MFEKHIWSIYQYTYRLKIIGRNTRVLALVIFNDNRKKIARKIFRVLNCVIYTIIGKYVCIDYLGSEKSQSSDLRLGVIGRYKHYDTDYDNVLGIGIPDPLLIFFVFSRIFKEQ